MKNFNIKNYIFLLAFCLATTVIYPSSDCDDEYDTHCVVRSTTKFKCNAWKILIAKERAYFISKEGVTEIAICEGNPIVRTKKEESCTPFGSTSKQIKAAIELIKKVHIARSKDMTNFIEELESGYTAKCHCQTRHK